MKKQAEPMARPLQVYVEERELERLEAWSRKRGWTKSQAVRAAVAALTRDETGDPLLAASGMIQGLPKDLSANIDRALQETFVAKARPQTKRKRVRRSLRRR